METFSTSRIPPIINCMSEVLLLFRVTCFYPPLCTNCLSVCHPHLVSSLRAVPEMDFLPAAPLWGDSTLFGADSVGTRLPAGYQLTPAEFAGTSVLQTHKMGNWAHKCLFALQFGICIHSDGFFSCANVVDTSAKWMCSRRRGPLKTYISFQKPAGNLRSATKIGVFMNIFYIFSPFREIPDRIQFIVHLLLFEGGLFFSQIGRGTSRGFSPY